MANGPQRVKLDETIGPRRSANLTDLKKPVEVRLPVIETIGVALPVVERTRNVLSDHLRSGSLRVFGRGIVVAIPSGRYDLLFAVLDIGLVAIDGADTAYPEI